MSGFHGDSPPIRIRNGGSIVVRTDLGRFIDERDEWRQEHAGTAGARRLQVRIKTGGNETTLEGRFVRITYSTKGREQHIVIRSRQLCCIPWKGRVFIAPGTATVADRGTALLLDKGQDTTLLRVVVGRYPGDSAAQRHPIEGDAVTKIDIYPRRH